MTTDVDRLKRRLFMRMIDRAWARLAVSEVDLRRTEQEGKRIGDGKGVDTIQWCYKHRKLDERDVD